MAARRPVGHRAPTRSTGAGLFAAAGIVLLAGGISLLIAPPVVQARSFDVEATVPTTVAEADAPAAGVHSPTAETTAAEMPTAAETAVAASPTRVSFTGTPVAADLVPVAALASGALQLPDDPAQVGWWVGGAAPGEPDGTMVLAGHIAGSGRSGAMSVLLDAEPGQPVTVEDRGGSAYQYRIVSRSTSPKASLDPALFATDGAPRLVLITCGGTFDAASGHYTDNVVVIAEPIAG